jgi:hypothetical protein
MESLLAPEALWFTAPAAAGTLFFLIRLAMLAFGGVGDFDGHGGGLDGGVGLDHGAAGLDHGDASDTTHHGDPGLAAQFLSVQGLTTFLMGFGWTGYAAVAGLGWSRSGAAVIGVVGGVLLVLLLGSLFRSARKLEASGTLDIARAAGTTGEVYANVPARGQGVGQVRVVVDGRERIVNAISAGMPIPTRSRVKVVQVNPDHTLTVQSL